MKLPRAPMRLTPAFAFSYVARSLQECLGRRRFGQNEMKQVIDFFGSAECAFCGSADVKRWDHLVAVKNGGETVLGNMVLSCAPCDDSKQDQPFETWLRNRAASSGAVEVVQETQQRIARLGVYASHFAYEVLPLSKRLTEQELGTVAEIETRAAKLRADIEALIHSFRDRTGSV